MLPSTLRSSTVTAGNAQPLDDHGRHDASAARSRRLNRLRIGRGEHGAERWCCRRHVDCEERDRAGCGQRECRASPSAAGTPAVRFVTSKESSHSKMNDTTTSFKPSGARARSIIRRFDGSLPRRSISSRSTRAPTTSSRTWERASHDADRAEPSEMPPARTIAISTRNSSRRGEPGPEHLSHPRSGRGQDRLPQLHRGASIRPAFLAQPGGEHDKHRHLQKLTFPVFSRSFPEVTGSDVRNCGVICRTAARLLRGHTTGIGTSCSDDYSPSCHDRRQRT